MPSLKMPALFAFSVTGVSVRQCVWESVPADTFKGSIYMVQTEAELHPLPVCQPQGILGARLGLAPWPHSRQTEAMIQSPPSWRRVSSAFSRISWPCLRAGWVEVSPSRFYETEGLTELSGLAPGRLKLYRGVSVTLVLEEKASRIVTCRQKS